MLLTAESSSPSLSHSLTCLMVAADEQNSQFYCNQTVESPFQKILTEAPCHLLKPGLPFMFALPSIVSDPDVQWETVTLCVLYEWLIVPVFVFVFKDHCFLYCFAKQPLPCLMCSCIPVSLLVWFFIPFHWLI